MNVPNDLKYCLCGCILLLVFQCKARENYFTRNGTLLIAVNNSNEAVKIHSSEVQILLNLKTAEFQISLPIWRLHSGIDSLDQKFEHASDNWMYINGILNLNEIKTEPHESYHFKFDAKLKYKELKRDLKGYGHLEHIPGNDQPACRLGLNFEINDLEIFSGFRKDFIFQVIQSILNQSIID